MIRYASKKDLDILNAFLKNFSKSYILDDNFENHPFSKYVLLEEYGDIIGFMNYSKIYDRLELEYIYIVEKYRRKGYASKFIDFLIEIGIKEKALNITLEVSEINNSAIGLYKKKGFEIVAVREKYYNNNNGYVMLRKM